MALLCHYFDVNCTQHVFGLCALCRCHSLAFQSTYQFSLALEADGEQIDTWMSRCFASLAIGFHFGQHARQDSLDPSGSNSVALYELTSSQVWAVKHLTWLFLSIHLSGSRWPMPCACVANGWLCLCELRVHEEWGLWVPTSPFKVRFFNLFIKLNRSIDRSFPIKLLI